MLRRKANHIEKERAHVETRLSELQREYFALHSQDALSPVKKEELEREIRSLNKRKKALNAPNGLQGQELSIFDAPGKFQQEQEKAERLQKKIEQYISESQRSKKLQLKEEIEQLKWDLIEASLREQYKLEHLEALKGLRHKNIKPFFIWKLEFSDVFQEKGGFDIIIANPPYVGESGNKEVFRPIASGNLKPFYLGKMDLFYFFFHLALNITHKSAFCAFITTNYYFTASGAKKLREDLKRRSRITEIIDFGDMKIFDSARGQHNAITLFEHGGHQFDTVVKRYIGPQTYAGRGASIHDVLTSSTAETSNKTVPTEKLYDGENSYIRLTASSGGLDDPLEDAVDIMAKAKFRLLDHCEIAQGVVTGCDKVTRKHHENFVLSNNVQVNDGIYVYDMTNERDANFISNLPENERNILRPFFKNSDIKQYTPNNEASKYLLYFSGPLDARTFPNLFDRMMHFKPILEARLVQYGVDYHWTAIHRTREERFFTGYKIVVPYRSKENNFAKCKGDWFFRSDCYSLKMRKESKYTIDFLLGVLNSRPVFHWLRRRGKTKGDILEIFQAPLSEIPIPQCDAATVSRLEELVLIAVKETEAKKPNKIKLNEIQSKIDSLVCLMYGIPNELITVVTDSGDGS